MERFKVQSRQNDAQMTVIYIPIWRDLKYALGALMAYQAFIYIPIWRDLKTDLISSNIFFKFIYIPIWRDLKLSELDNTMILNGFTFQYGEI